MPPAEALHQLLPWYVTGQLDEGELADFRKHLDSCERCQAEQAFLERAQVAVERHGGAFLDDHPDSERVVAFARGELTGAEHDAVARHMEICATCPAEAKWITGEQTLGASPIALPRTRQAALAQDKSGSSGRWLWRLAAAAALVGALFVPTPWRDSGLQSGAFRVHLLTPPERDTAASPNVFEVRPDEAMFRFYVGVDAEDHQFPCSVEVLADDGRVAAMARNVTRDKLVSGTFQFVRCTLQDCPAGSYRTEVKAADGTVLESIAFEIVEQANP